MPYQESKTFDGVSGVIRLFRRRAGITQAELGRRLFVDRNTICRYEMGTIIPSKAVLALLLQLLQDVAQPEEYAPIVEIMIQRGMHQEPEGRPEP